MDAHVLDDLGAATRRHARRAAHRLRARTGTPPAMVAAYLAATPSPRLHLGCGGALLAGWLNTDRDPAPGAAYLDLTSPWPLPSSTFAHVLAEHVIEHLTLAHGRAMVAEAARVLRPGGRVRVSTPDLAIVAGAALDGDEPRARGYRRWVVSSFGDGAPASETAVLLDTAMRAWGHRFLYDEPTLRAALEDAGLTAVRRLPYRVSEDAALDGVEGRGIDAVGIRMRTFETLALEAVKPPA